MDAIELPKVFLIIYDYFDEKPKRLRVENLFLQKSKQDELELLESHMAMSNYSYLYKVNNPVVVCCYFKAILQFIAEPFCTFALYPKFKQIC